MFVPVYTAVDRKRCLLAGGNLFGRGTAWVRSNNLHLLQTCVHFRQAFFGDYTTHTIFPGLNTERRHAFVVVVLQLKHCRRMRSPIFIFASSVKMTGGAGVPWKSGPIVPFVLVTDGRDGVEGRSKGYFRAGASHPRADGRSSRL